MNETRINYRIDRDTAKASVNLQKHGQSFETLPAYCLILSLSPMQMKIIAKLRNGG